MRLKELLLCKPKKRKELKDAIQQSGSNPDKCNILLKQKMQKHKEAWWSNALAVDELERAEMERKTQKEKYADEIATLQKNKAPVKKSIYKLDPILVEGVLKVGSRLNKSELTEEAKHLVILSKDLHITNLILHHIYQELGHSGRNHMLARLRQKYWIPKSNSAIRKVISQCSKCKCLHAKPVIQKMPDLPDDRVIADKLPFTNVGIDFFRPLEIKRGRSLVKRYGVIFTCLTV